MVIYMTSFYKEFNSLKLKLIDNRKISIENYSDIYNVSANLINIDNYNIKGNNLSIVLLERNLIVIEGLIGSIEILCKNE